MEIKYLNAFESTREINKVLWKITSKKTIMLLSSLLIIGVLLSVYGALNYKEYSKSKSAYSESNVQILSVNYYSNRHIAESIGVVLVVFSIVLFRLHSIKKKTFFRKIDEISRRFLETGNQYIIRINENYVEYDSLDLFMKINWIRFSNYKIYENFILMKSDSSIIGIDKRLISETDLDVLLKFLKSNNIQKIK